MAGAGLLALRDHVIAPIPAGVRSSRRRHKHAHWTRVGRDYETLRIAIQALLHDIGIQTLPTAALTTFCRWENASSYATF